MKLLKVIQLDHKLHINNSFSASHEIKPDMLHVHAPSSHTKLLCSTWNLKSPECLCCNCVI